MFGTLDVHDPNTCPRPSSTHRRGCRTAPRLGVRHRSLVAADSEHTDGRARVDQHRGDSDVGCSVHYIDDIDTVDEPSTGCCRPTGRDTTLPPVTTPPVDPAPVDVVDVAGGTVSGIRTFDAVDVDAVILDVSARLGPPTSDSGWQLTVGESCASSTDFRVLWWGFRMTFERYQGDGVVRDELAGWTVGDPTSSSSHHSVRLPGRPHRTSSRSRASGWGRPSPTSRTRGRTSTTVVTAASSWSIAAECSPSDSTTPIRSSGSEMVPSIAPSTRCADQRSPRRRDPYLHGFVAVEFDLGGEQGFCEFDRMARAVESASKRPGRPVVAPPVKIGARARCHAGTSAADQVVYGSSDDRRGPAAHEKMLSILKRRLEGAPDAPICSGNVGRRRRCSAPRAMCRLRSRGDAPLRRRSPTVRRERFPGPTIGPSEPAGLLHQVRVGVGTVASVRVRA